MPTLHRPEFDTDAEPRLIAKALDLYGCALVRSVLPAGPLNQMLQRAAHNFMRLDSLKLRNDSWVNEVDVGFIDENQSKVIVQNKTKMELPMSLWSGAEPGFYWKHIDVYQHSVFRFLETTKLKQVLHCVFGGNFSFSFDASRVRRQSLLAPDNRLRLHQDASSADYGPQRVIAAWIPLHDCGTLAPGLQVYPRKVTELLPIAEPHWFIRQDCLGDIGKELWHPIFRAGDLLLFDSRTIHGTYMAEGMQDLRISIDVRAHEPKRPPKFMAEQPEYLVIDERRETSNHELAESYPREKLCITS